MGLMVLLAVGATGLSAASIPVITFRATDLEGMTRLAAQPGAHATVWIFLTHDCPICNGYAPLINRLAARYRSKGVQWNLVYSEPALTLADLRTHARDYGFKATLIADPEVRLARACGATTTPEVAVFDESSQLVYRGRIDDLYPEIGRSRSQAQTHDLENALNQLLAGHPVAQPRTRAVGCALETPAHAAPVPIIP